MCGPASGERSGDDFSEARKATVIVARDNPAGTFNSPLRHRLKVPIPSQMRLPQELPPEERSHHFLRLKTP